MKTIIIPLDFSEESLNGLDLGMMFAKKTSATIIMVHVIPRSLSEDVVLTEKKIGNAKLKLENIRDSCKERSDFNCEMSYLISRGKVFSDISEIAEKHEDPVTILSTHGASGFEELLIGGNAYKIVSSAKNPVITIRQSYLSSSIEKIVLPLDSSLHSGDKVPYTVSLAKQLNSEIHIVTVQSSKHKSVEKKLHKYAAQVGADIQDQEVPVKIVHLHEGHPVDLTLGYSRSVNADLISIMMEQESNLLLGNYAHQMINKSSFPVLLLPANTISPIKDKIVDIT